MLIAILVLSSSGGSLVRSSPTVPGVLRVLLLLLSLLLSSIFRFRGLGFSLRRGGPRSKLFQNRPAENFLEKKNQSYSPIAIQQQQQKMSWVDSIKNGITRVQAQQRAYIEQTLSNPQAPPSNTGDWMEQFRRANARLKDPYGPDAETPPGMQAPPRDPKFKPGKLQTEGEKEASAKFTTVAVLGGGLLVGALLFTKMK